MIYSNLITISMEFCENKKNYYINQNQSNSKHAIFAFIDFMYISSIYFDFFIEDL
jgi:hypothetical protein